MKNTLFNDDGLFERQLALTDGERREKVNSLIPREKKNASLAAGVILPLALKECGISGTVKLEGGRWDKPRLTSPKGTYFNVSHSGDWTVLALADNEVGVDIQQIKPVDLHLAKRFFAEEEWKQIEAAGDRAEALFYRFWTVKEAYLKALGTGLNRPLNSFTVHFNAGGARVDDPECDEVWLISEFFDLDGYAVACCAKEYAPDENIRELKIL